MASDSSKNISLGNDEYEGISSSVEFNEEGVEEYFDQDSFTSSSPNLSLVEQIQPDLIKAKERGPSDTISTLVLSFQSSSLIKSTFSPVSGVYSDNNSDIYLQTSSEGLQSKASESFSSGLELTSTNYGRGTLPQHKTRIEISTLTQVPVKIQPAEILTKNLCLKIPFLNDIVDNLVNHTKKANVHYSEKLIISIDKSRALSNCHLNQKLKLSLPKNEVAGSLTLSTEETAMGIHIKKYGYFKEEDFTNGFESFARMTNGFKLIEEKITEFQQNAKEKKEKSLHVFIDNDKYMAYRTDKFDKIEQKYRGCIKLAQQHNFVLDGCMCSLMRHLIAVKYVGSFQCYSITLAGKLCRYVISIEESRLVPVNEYLIELILMKKSSYDYEENRKFEMSETFFLTTGAMVYHAWKHSPYIVHIDPIMLDSKRKLNNCMELTWKSDCILRSMFTFEKESCHCLIQNYLNCYSEIMELLNDFIISLLNEKPISVYKFACDFFENV